MHIAVYGKNKVLSRKEIRSIIRWMAYKLMSKKMCSGMRIKVVNKPRFRHKGEIEERSHKVFTIYLRSTLSRKEQIQTLAHEMVHAKQFARREIKETKYDHQWKWGNRVIDKKIVKYRDYPWEMEAQGREKVLYKKYCSFINESA